MSKEHSSYCVHLESIWTLAWHGACTPVPHKCTTCLTAMQVHLKSAAVCRSVEEHLASVCIPDCTLTATQRRWLRDAFRTAEADWWMEEGVDVPVVSVMCVLLLA